MVHVRRHLYHRARRWATAVCGAHSGSLCVSHGPTRMLLMATLAVVRCTQQRFMLRHCCPQWTRISRSRTRLSSWRSSSAASGWRSSAAALCSRRARLETATCDAHAAAHRTLWPVVLHSTRRTQYGWACWCMRRSEPALAAVTSTDAASCAHHVCIIPRPMLCFAHSGDPG